MVMAYRRAASLARRLHPSLTSYHSLQCIRSKPIWHELPSRRRASSQPGKPRPPNVSGLYKALTRESPSEAPDPNLTAILTAAESSKDANAAIKALTSNLTTTQVHPTHVTTAVRTCLPTNPDLAKSLLSTLSPTLPGKVLTPARATLAKFHTSNNDPQSALSALNFPYEHLSTPASHLLDRVDALHLGSSPFHWGTLIKSLTQLNRAPHACAVVDAALTRRIAVTDAFLHLCIDAYRLSNRWRDANRIFDTAVAKGLVPSERTVASLIYALTCRVGRQQVERRRVAEVVDLVQSPSAKFLRVALMGLTSVGAVGRAERVFVELRGAGMTEDHMEKMVAGLGNYLELLPADEVDAVDGKTYNEISGRVDELWEEYQRLFPAGRLAGSVLAKVIRVKTRCFQAGQAVDVLEGLVESGRGDLMDVSHIGNVLGTVELTCDVGELRRLLKVMERVGLEHDMRSVAFWMGTLIGDGDMAEAVDVVKKVVVPMLKDGVDGVKSHYPTVLLRRLKSLVLALEEGGVGRVKEVDEVVQVVERMRHALQGKEVGERER